MRTRPFITGHHISKVSKSMGLLFLSDRNLVMDPQEVELTLDECITVLSNHGDSEFKAMERAQQLLHNLGQMQRAREDGIKDTILGKFL